MAMRKLTKEEFCLVLQRMIYRLGPDKALRQDIRDRQLYSGPDWKIANELKADFKAAGIKYLGNEEMALAQAARENAATINQTYIGRVLLRKNLRAYFQEVYHDDFLAREAEYQVWAWASRAFVAAGSDKVITAVCGAAEARVYRHEEQYEMEKNRNYKTINDQFADAELDILKRHEPTFHRRTSLNELRHMLRMAWQEAKHSAVGTQATAYYRRKEFYLLQRRNEFIAAGKTVPPAYSLSFNERRMREAMFLMDITNHYPRAATLAVAPASAKLIS